MAMAPYEAITIRRRRERRALHASAEAERDEPTSELDDDERDDVGRPDRDRAVRCSVDGRQAEAGTG